MNFPAWSLSDPFVTWTYLIIQTLFTLTTLSAAGMGMYMALAVGNRDLLNIGGYRDYLIQHGKTLLIVLAGVGPIVTLGMWLILMLLSPDTLTTIVFEFIWVWILQGLAYVLEITTLFVLVRSLEFKEKEVSAELGWSLAILGLVTLIVANATLSFQQTPGTWIETLTFEDAWFNSAYLASLFLRILVSISVAGVWAMVTVSSFHEGSLKKAVSEYNAGFVIAPFLLMPVGLIWYLNTIDPVIAEKLTEGFVGFSTENHSFLSRLMLGTIFASVAMFLFALIGGVLNADGFKRSMAVWMVVLAGLVTGLAEYSRHLVGNPYAITGYMYHNSIRINTADELTTGFLSEAKWAIHKEVTEQNKLAAGKELYDLQFGTAIPAGFNELTTFCVGKTYQETLDFINVIAWGSESNLYTANLPSFLGSSSEAEALAAWISYQNGTFEATEEQVNYLNAFVANPYSVLASAE